MSEARRQLTQTKALDAAYRDLYTYCGLPEVTASLLSHRIAVFHDLLLAVGHNVQQALDDLRQLGGNPARRRYLSDAPVSTKHTVWIGYDRAHVHGVIEIDNVTFFPPESSPEDLSWARQQGTEWVAVRIELQGGFTDPVRSAIDLADALVVIAKTRSFGSHWDLLNGYKHIGPRFRQTSALGRELVKWVPNDAGRVLQEMAGRSHVALDRHLMEALRRLQETSGQVGATSLLPDVSIIEDMATLCGTRWVDHLHRNLSKGWALRRMRKELFDTVFLAAAANNQLTDIAEAMGHDQGFYFMQHIDAPLTYITDVVNALPDGFTRLQVLEIAKRTNRPGGLRRWFTNLLEEHLVNVELLYRCRTSLMHGGPTHPVAVQTAARFAHRQASKTLMVALDGKIGGSSVLESHQRHTAQWSAREAKLNSGLTSKEALYGDI